MEKPPNLVFFFLINYKSYSTLTDKFYLIQDVSQTLLFRTNFFCFCFHRERILWPFKPLMIFRCERGILHLSLFQKFASLVCSTIFNLTLTIVEITTDRSTTKGRLHYNILLSVIYTITFYIILKLILNYFKNV